MTENTQANEPSREFALQRIYIKDVSFETPNSPTIFTAEWKPESNLNLNSNVTKLDNDLFEVVLTVTVTTKLAEKTAYLVEVQQAGVFAIAGMEGPALEHAIGAFCPNILFPYAREAIDSLVVRGNFPPMHLAPINFEAVFAEAKKRQAEQAQSSQEGAANQPETTH